jgi:Na+-transporting methylmalonyl-CoA/oxaloacetate decarboxylase gamma subunit
MNTTITTALLITLVGMGLVFGAIIVLWVGMAVLVDLAEKWNKRSTAHESKPKSDQTREKANRKIAAAIGAAYAIAHSQQSTVHEFPLPSTAFVSAWQAVMRSKNFSTRRQIR